MSQLPGGPGAYARPERERRFLLAAPPGPADVVLTRHLTDRYLTGTRLRLRLSRRADTGAEQYKLTQKIPAAGAGPIRAWTTTAYLTRDEYDVFATLPAAVLVKSRVSVPPLGVDVFGGPLAGLVLAEAEFASDEECAAFRPPTPCLAEVTADARFTGGRLARASRAELLAWLAGHGLAG